MAYDMQTLKAKTDILALVGRDTTLKRIARDVSGHGPEYAGPCFKCNSGHRIHVQPNASGGGRFFCRECHPEWGDAIEYVMWRDGVTFSEACKALGGVQMSLRASTRNNTVKTPGPRPVVSETEAPSAVWQARARDFVAWARGKLWESPDALAYLHDRGLSDDTIREAGLGYNPQTLRGDVKRWGQRGAFVWLPRGWVIPCEAGGQLYYAKIRRHPEDLEAERKRTPDRTPDKYWSVKGSRITMYGLDAVTSSHHSDVVICEGEFDALLLRQHVGKLCGVVALASASNKFDAQTVAALVVIRHVWLALDDDVHGRGGEAELLQEWGRLRALPKLAHDVTDAWKEGHDLSAWIVRNIGPSDLGRRLMWCEHWLRENFDDHSPLVAEMIRECGRIRGKVHVSNL